MKNLDSLIEKFKELKEELSKNMNMSYAVGQNKPTPQSGTSGGQGGMFRTEAPMDIVAMSEKLKTDKNGQWKLDKVDPQENINIAHPQSKAKMSDGVNKEEGTKLGTNQRLANPPENMLSDGRGKVHHVKKDEGTNEEAGTSRPHNKGKFKVMDEAKEKESKKEKVAGKPYNGDGGSAVHKADKCKECGQSPCKCGNAENKFRHGGFGL